jgi:hypothetical protein
MAMDCQPDRPAVPAPAPDAQENPADVAESPVADGEPALEQWIETDPSLAPTGPSALLVQERVLEPDEVDALLEGLSTLLADADAASANSGAAFGKVAGAVTGALSHAAALFERRERQEFGKEHSHEPHSTPGRRHGGDPKLSPSAWLFADDAGIGRSTRHQQSHHLRAHRSAGKKAAPPSRQAQGSLFGNQKE